MENLSPLRDDDEENEVDEAKMLLIGENGTNGDSFSPRVSPSSSGQPLLLSSRFSITTASTLPTALAATLSSLKPAGSTTTPMNILELGSGTGVVGIAAAITLSASVTVTDLPHVLDNLSFNAEANAQTVARFEGQVHAAPLRWGEADDVELLGPNVDLVVASDVVYHDHLYEPLLKTLRLMVAAKGSEGKRLIFLMAHLRRWKKESVFFKKARKVFDVDVIHSDEPRNGARSGVLVYRFVAKQPNQNGRIVSC
ncbi:hypothetical protein Bca52824_087743 [Brassica carinata]|uniref:Uncharacterized protein n=1 Tax=Brassica carinata TaxID=52824 RepID=A0A8X7TN23_BRACI|nr:hypothetical protein Bca52824_087743 [Brassica carinata]